MCVYIILCSALMIMPQAASGTPDPELGRSQVRVHRRATACHNSAILQAKVRVSYGRIITGR